MVVIVVVTGFMVVVVTVVILVFVVLCCVMFVVVVVVVYWLAQINPIGRCRSSIQLHTAGLSQGFEFNLSCFSKEYFRRILQLHFMLLFRAVSFKVRNGWVISNKQFHFHLTMIF